MKKNSPSSSAYGPFISTRQPLSRRHFLQGTGIALALPFLEVMTPTFAQAAQSASSLTPGAKPRRMIGICNNLGLLPDQFFPKGEGRTYVASPYLKPMEAHRDDFTVFSGVSYPSVDGGHPADICFLTAAPHPASASFRNTISLDQMMAERIGMHTRFPSLTLAVNNRSRSLSYTGTGVAIPPEEKAAHVFKQLFLQGTPAGVFSTRFPARRRNSGATWAPATVIASTNTLRACAIWKIAWPSRAAGSTSRSRSWMRRCRWTARVRRNLRKR
jgi:hypothetical protein